MEKDMVTVREAARIADRMTQSIYIAVHKKRLKSYWEKGRLYINRKDLEEYIACRYCRDHCTDANGELIYDHSKGRYSPTQIEKLTGIDQQMLYYWLRTNQLKHTRIGAKYILDIEDAKKLRDEKKVALK